MTLHTAEKKCKNLSEYLKHFHTFIQSSSVYVQKYNLLIIKHFVETITNCSAFCHFSNEHINVRLDCGKEGVDLGLCTGGHFDRYCLKRKGFSNNIPQL